MRICKSCDYYTRDDAKYVCPECGERLDKVYGDEKKTLSDRREKIYAEKNPRANAGGFVIEGADGYLRSGAFGKLGAVILTCAGAAALTFWIILTLVNNAEFGVLTVVIAAVVIVAVNLAAVIALIAPNLYAEILKTSYKWRRYHDRNEEPSASIISIGAAIIWFCALFADIITVLLTICTIF